MRMHHWIAAAMLLLGGTTFAAPPSAGGGCVPSASVFCVTNTGDNSGTNPNPGQGTGTLRQAMIDANAAGGDVTIGFNIIGGGPQTITLAGLLPAINASSSAFALNLTSLLIDGYSQPGSVTNTQAPDQGGLNSVLIVEIVGTGTYGFYYDCCGHPNVLNLTFQGLAMRGFDYPIIGQSSGASPKAKLNVYGCFLGTNVAGTAAAAQGNLYGARSDYDEMQVGGTQPWQRNLISGNSIGVSVTPGASTTNVVIEGNLIGTDISGTTPIPNTQFGLDIEGDWPGIRVGCTGAGCTDVHAASRNVISGNGLAIQVSTTSTSPGGAQIKGNYVGSDWTGTKPPPIGPSGSGCPSTYCGGIETIGYGSAPALIIGGFNPGEANLIAYNNGPGIWNNPNSATSGLSASFDNQANSVHNNAGVDVGFQYDWLANDPGDADTGVNNKQNYPVIQSASVGGNQLTVTYSVDTDVANATYPLRIDFYVDIDEGSGTFLVSDSYPSAGAGMQRTIALTLPANALPLAGFVATATDANGYSSEISPSFVFDRIFADRFEGH